MRFITWKDRKNVIRDLKPVYRAINAETAETALDATRPRASATR